MLVEDDPATRSALKRIFSRQGWAVTATSTLHEALARLADGFDSVILDLMLPDGDGSELLRAIRRGGQPIRVVVTTGSDDPEHLRAVRALDPEAVLSKPVSLADIHAALGPRG